MNMLLPKPFVPTLNIEDLKNGGNQKAIHTIKAGVDLRAAKELARQLRRLDLRYTNFEYLKQALMPLMNGYFIGSTATNISEPIYRAVLCHDRPTLKSELGSPPPEKVGLGRANNPGKPMFYGSTGCHSTVMELAPAIGDRLAISKWQTKANLPLIFAGYTAAAFKEKAGMSRYENLPWVNTYATESLATKHGNNIVNEFIAHEFTKLVPKGEEWRYKISAAITELTLNAHSFGINGASAIELTGILYPSTPHEGNADNVALKARIAESALEFVSVQYIEISSKTAGPTYSMRGLDFADSISEAGEINWQNSFPPHRIAGTDHTARATGDGIEILGNKGQVVVSAPYKQTEFDMEHLKAQS